MEKKLYRYDFNKTLRNMPDISPKERDYLNKTFKRELVDGLSPWELKQKVNKLQLDKKDELNQWELRGVKERLLKNMGK